MSSRPSGGLVILATACFVLPTPGAAQTAADSGLLALPEGLVIMCGIVPVPAEQASGKPLVMRQFRFAAHSASPVSGSERTVFVAFDSSGQLIFLQDVIPQLPLGGVSATVASLPDGSTSGFRLPITLDSSAFAAAMRQGNFEALQAAVRPGAQQPLSEIEIAKARTLAAWLWDRRCGRSQ